ncbi:phosphoribosyl-ATP diphosphatase [Rhodopila globiformis]|uniref:Phosphoribosyl-ATP pyrophosphatase n=1 Tax=Rhodopila globiformis TaxID=1071 RepID=A0A2S6N5U9_RHOGL|nr:phosphoribosyl-ATP diphosphatase [Rhodopila globiformis]PPQ29967.1 phosphoribosyl-ATP diphosphatase [Rhodopila globiformis]
MAKTDKKKAAPRLPKAAKPAKAKKARILPPPPHAAGIDVLDRLFAVVESRRDGDPEASHSARLLSRGVAKVAQKFGEEAVECLIEAVAGNHDALVAESADVLYHLIVLWVSSGVTATEVWTELARREGISGIAEKAARAKPAAALKFGTSKLP